MNENSELFPFPVESGAEADENAGKSENSGLPAFPGEPPLDDEELRTLRQMLAGYRAANGIPDPAPSETPGAEAKVVPATESRQDDGGLAMLWSQLKLSDPVEIEALQTFKELFSEIVDADDLLKIIWSIAGFFPLKKFLRNATPEQKLFVLNVLGDKFLHGLAGFVHPVRKKLLKAVCRFFSGVSESCSFLSMEGEPFNLQYHERVAGAASSGKIVREMHGFLVVTTDSRRVIRLGQVLT